jgi:hypothetical protein
MVQQSKFLTLLLVVFLSACGPGTGGTGTGPILSSAGTDINGNTNSTTNSTANSPSLTSNPLGSSSGQTISGIIDRWVSDDLKTLLIRESNRITISTACASYEFSGPTAFDGNQLTTFNVGARLVITLLETQQLSFVITNYSTGAIELQGRLNNKAGSNSQTSTPLASPCARTTPEIIDRWTSDRWISDDLKTLLIRESNRITISTACASYEFSGPTTFDGSQLTMFTAGGRLVITLLETQQLTFVITNYSTGAVELQGRLNNTASQVTTPLGPCVP